MSSKNKSMDKPPSGGAVRIGKLDTLPDVRRELGRLYRAARKAAGNDLSPYDASKLGYLLSLVGRTVEAADVDKRLRALEELIDHPRTPSPHRPKSGRHLQ